MHEINCGCDYRPVELLSRIPPRCTSCGTLVDVPAALPAPPDARAGDVNEMGFFCICGADEMLIRVRLTA